MNEELNQRLDEKFQDLSKAELQEKIEDLMTENGDLAVENTDMFKALSNTKATVSDLKRKLAKTEKFADRFAEQRDRLLERVEILEAALARSSHDEVAIERVRALHVPVERGYLPGDLRCQECGISYHSEEMEPWPCDTIKALDDVETT